MLEGTETLKFPLPPVIDIDFIYSSYEKSALEKFLGMDGQGVKKINLTLDQNTRLNVLQNTTIDYLDELNIVKGLSKIWSQKDTEELCGVMKKTKLGLLSICGIQIDTEIAEAVSRLPDHTEIDLSGNQGTDKSACVTLVQKAANMKSLHLCNCGIQIDTEIAEAISNLPDHTQLDLSGNQVTSKSACITLIHKAATMKSLNIHECISNCGIQITRGIAEAVSRLPDDIQLDLSGNELTKMDPRLLPGVLAHMPEDKKIDMTKCGITIDVDVVRALSKMPQLKSLKASYNKLTPEAAKKFSMSQLQELYLCECGISNTVCVPLMISLSKHCPMLEVLDLYDNCLTSDDWCHHVQMKKLTKLELNDCGIRNTVCVPLTNSLSKHCPLLEVLNLGFNRLSSSGVWDIVDQIKNMKKLRQLSFSGNPCVEDWQCREKLKEALLKSNPGLKFNTGY